MSLMSKDAWNKEWEALAKEKRDAMTDAAKARRDAERWDEENMMAAPNLIPPEEQRIPAKLFDSYGVMPDGWTKVYNTPMWRTEVRDPRGRVWISDPNDRRYLMLDASWWEKAQDETIQRVINEGKAAEIEEEKKPLDRFAGLDI
jgi:hypothetical protein